MDYLKKNLNLIRSISLQNKFIITKKKKLNALIGNPFYFNNYNHRFYVVLLYYYLYKNNIFFFLHKVSCCDN